MSAASAVEAATDNAAQANTRESIFMRDLLKGNVA
jgi:hypothetical protein